MDNLDFNYFCAGCAESEEYRRANCFTRYRLRQYNRGEYITFKGDRVRELSIAVSGVINVSFPLDSGLITRSVNHSSPVPVGGVALFSKENRYLVDTRAVEPTTLISVSRDDVRAQMGRCERFLVNFIDYSASRVEVLTTHLAQLTQRGIRAKVAYYILNHRSGSSYHLGRSIRDLADYLCVERPSLSRLLSSLVAEGVITHKGGAGVIVDLERLRSFVE